jgi:hypothetical protein
MTIHLLPASEVHQGDLLECPITQTWKTVAAVDRQFGRLYFVMMPDRAIRRSALTDELVAVGKEI